MGNTRREIIQGMLSEQPFVSLKELSARFPELSSMTLRRDIEYFESQGECIKVRGGARSMKFITTSLEESSIFVCTPIPQQRKPLHSVPLK